MRKVILAALVLALGVVALVTPGSAHAWAEANCTNITSSFCRAFARDDDTVTIRVLNLRTFVGVTSNRTASSGGGTITGSGDGNVMTSGDAVAFGMSAVSVNTTTVTTN